MITKFRKNGFYGMFLPLKWINKKYLLSIVQDLALDYPNPYMIKILERMV
jgi:hypothetical protein